MNSASSLQGVAERGNQLLKCPLKVFGPINWSINGSIKVGPLKEDIFLTPSMVYISVIITHIKNYNLFSHVGPLWATFMYCIYTCLFDLWVLLIHLLILIEKFSPLPGFDTGTSPVPSRYATN